MTQSDPRARLVHKPSLMPGVVFLCAWLLAAGLLCACGKGEDKAAKGKRPIPVAVAEAKAMDVPVLVVAVGNVEAYASVVIKPQVSGVIAKQLVRDGQDVRKGTPLFVIDQRTYQASLQEALARLQKDQAQSKKAEDDLKRFQALYEQGAVSREQLEQIQANTIGLRASLALDQAQVQQARLQLGYASIASPIDGRAGHVLVQEGNVVKANDDRVLVVINQVEPIYVSFAVPERYLPEIQKQAALGELRVEAQTAEGVVLDTGKLDSIDNAVDKATGTIRLKAEFRNKAKTLWPGQFVRAFLRLAERKNAVVIPAQAVQTGVSGSFVFVVKAEQTVELRNVSVSPAPEQAVVVDQGVAPGEKVVVDGQVMLVPGAMVEIKAAAPAAPASATQANATQANATQASITQGVAPPLAGTKP
ncbi:MAG: efflux RND transporter periplasmic adaptor subunit [Humidesulfovibrio sp.]|uniref:efflux RND transporter periplasmic adaptor subunit n=1 Tax=Humidesulfovibrio sp. TaxID=2910988 RepID=UPI0027E5DC5B|nr:efflux RND transporter periplasmic adaptor subunit [Humidesulfovibrio sp.]MDQ7833903.1 efflux RND transporter periplasmic adaptor subunit [Humidesulfovibrio sp.]